MKRNLGKVSFIMIFASLVIALVTTTLSADNNKGKSFIEGKYAATSVCYALSSPTKPNDNLIFTGTVNNTFATSQTIWTFNSDGTGTVKGTQLAIAPSTSASVAEISWQIVYEVKDSGEISIDFPDGSPGILVYTAGPFKGYKYTSLKFPQTGMISQDHKTITIGAITPDITQNNLYKLDDTFLYTFYGIISCGRILTRVHD
jgi:hypothetical protein